jgi:thiosulfate/3-mercaptopyruvate sulfurtransferase
MTDSPLPPLLSAAWLTQHLPEPALVVFDATWFMPSEQKDARAEYRRMHLPGARFFDIDTVADTDTSLPHMVPSAGRFARLMDELGLRNDDHVVLYDQKGLYSAARGWWLLRLFGHERVSVLDGGLPAWRAVGGAVESGEVKWASTTYRPALRTELWRGLGDLKANLSTQAELVLDARSAARFAACVPEPRPGLAGGHIPGSRSLPYEQLLNADQTMKSPAQLRTVFAEAGVRADRPVITSCGSGLTAAILSLGLAVAGLPTGALYDGSWSEWGSLEDTPKATGE